MRIIYNLDEMTKVARGLLMGGSVGFIPTMGNLHSGHLARIQAADAECEISVMSIFVNPLQFSSLQEVANYPQDLQRDLQTLSTTKLDIVFIPHQEDVFPPTFSTYVDPLGPTAKRLEDTRNRNFVRGIATVMTKLLQIVRPDIAYFGQKDAQQVAIVRQLVRDLSIDVQLRILPTPREHDGLATSNRNQQLSDEERQVAPLLYQALLAGRASIEQGERRASAIKEVMGRVLSVHTLITPNYAAICHPDTLLDVEEVVPGTLLVIAAHVGHTRLTDTLLWADNGQWPI